MKIGAHISTAGGLLTVFERALQMGANCFQIFGSSPRMWKVPDVDSQAAAEFKIKLKKLDLLPSFIHIKYLVNIASPDQEIARKSMEAIISEMHVCSKLGLTGSMFHIGSTKDNGDNGFDTVVKTAKAILEQIPQDVQLILENSATSKKIGSSLEDIACLLEKINHPQIHVCLDTAHAFEAGYDIRTQTGVDAFVNKIETTIGLNKLALFHVNDSKSDLCSNRDLHENIGKGKIGLQSFSLLLNHPKLFQKPFILEVPGFENKGPDKENIDILKSLIT